MDTADIEKTIEKLVDDFEAKLEGLPEVEREKVYSEFINDNMQSVTSNIRGYYFLFSTVIMIGLLCKCILIVFCIFYEILILHDNNLIL